MKSGTIAVLLVVAFLAGASAGYPFGANYSHTTSSTQTRTSSQVSSSNSSLIDGLGLRVGVNASILHVGERLGISISLYNSLPSRLNLTIADDWQVLGLIVAFWSPCSYAEPVEMMIVRGNYTIDQLHVASSNYSYPTYVLCHEGGPVRGVDFEPASSEANITGYSCIATCSPFSARYDLVSNFSVNGYWAYPINSSEADDIFTPAPDGYCNYPPPCGVTFAYPEVGPIAQHDFTSGWYTLVVSDEWGQNVLLRFSVE
jgi:hypothetical protein